MVMINVAKEFTETPGARYKTQGALSGEECSDNILYPKFIESISNNEKLVVNLDGGYGYGSSFLEEAFGGLVRKLKEEKNIHYKDVKEIEIISDDNIVWIDKIKKYIDDEIKAVKGGK